MKHREYDWHLQDQKPVYAQSWEPDHAPYAVVNIIHAFGEHSGRYEKWAGLFVEKGFAVLASDLIGHGKSSGKRGYVKDYQVLLDQIDMQLQKSEELFPGSPKILYGHSMGGNLAINYAMTKDPPIHALIASAPWLRLAKDPPRYMLLFSKLLRPFYPSLTIKAGIDNTYRTHDPVVNQMVYEDPLLHRRMSLQLFHIVSERGLYAMKNIYKINRPFLIMHGSNDRWTSHEASLEMASNTSKLTRVKIWDGLYHELHNETSNAEVFKYILAWLKEMKIYKHGKIQNRGQC
jgi:alpha-beta hydrolase superfamily lysophospholipase